MIDVGNPVLTYTTCFILCLIVVSILGLAAEKRAQEAKNNPDAKAKNKAKAKPKKKPAQQAGEASESVFEKLEQDETNDAEDMENATEHPVEDQHGS